MRVITPIDAAARVRYAPRRSAAVCNWGEGMRVFILTLGTRGDFELFRLLGATLRRRGHRVVLGTSGFYAEATREAGLEFVQVGDGSRATLLSVLQSLAPIADLTRRTYAYYTDWLRPQLAAGRAAITADGAAADYFVSNLKMVLERNGSVLPTAFVTYDPPASREDLARYGSQKYGGRVLEIVAMSRPLVDADGRWGDEYRFTGFWHPEPRATWRPPAPLATFLEAGPPPLVVTLGSMVMVDPVPFRHALVRCLERAQQRAILIADWTALQGGEDGRLLELREAPYEWLFPRAAAVVHHGGVGTVAAALRAATPSILLPQIACQEILGRMLVREGLATGLFDLRRLDPAAVAEAIRRAGDADVRRATRRWQEVVAGEGGVERAADLIEEHQRRLQHAPA